MYTRSHISSPRMNELDDDGNKNPTLSKPKGKPPHTKTRKGNQLDGNRSINPDFNREILEDKLKSVHCISPSTNNSPGYSPRPDYSPRSDYNYSDESETDEREIGGGPLRNIRLRNHYTPYQVEEDFQNIPQLLDYDVMEEIALVKILQ